MSELQQTFVANTQMRAQTLAAGTQARARAGQVAVGGWLKGIAIRNAKELEDKKMALQHRQLELDRITKNRNYELGLASQRNQAIQVENQRLEGVRRSEQDSINLAANLTALKLSSKNRIEDQQATIIAAELKASTLLTAQETAAKSAEDAQYNDLRSKETIATENNATREALAEIAAEKAAGEGSLNRMKLEAEQKLDTRNRNAEWTYTKLLEEYELLPPIQKNNPAVIMTLITDLWEINTPNSIEAAKKLTKKQDENMVKVRRLWTPDDIATADATRARGDDVQPGEIRLDEQNVVAPVKGKDGAGNDTTIYIWTKREGEDINPDEMQRVYTIGVTSIGDAWRLINDGKNAAKGRRMMLGIAEASGLDSTEAIERYMKMKSWMDDAGKVIEPGPGLEKRLETPLDVIKGARASWAGLNEIIPSDGVDQWGATRWSATGNPELNSMDIDGIGSGGSFDSPTADPSGAAATPAAGATVVDTPAGETVAVAQPTMRPIDTPTYDFGKLDTQGFLLDVRPEYVTPLTPKRIKHNYDQRLLETPMSMHPNVALRAGDNIPIQTEAIFGAAKIAAGNFISAMNIRDADGNMLQAEQIRDQKKHITMQGVQAGFQAYLKLLEGKANKKWSASEAEGWDVESVVKEINEVREILEVIPKILGFMSGRKNVDPFKTSEKWNKNDQGIPESTLRIDQYSQAKWLGMIFDADNPVYQFHRTFSQEARGVFTFPKGVSPFRKPGQPMVRPGSRKMRKVLKASKGRRMTEGVGRNLENLAGPRSKSDPANWENR